MTQLAHFLYHQFLHLIADYPNLLTMLESRRSARE
jgi:hypothetical protein